MATVDPRLIFDYLVGVHGVSVASAAGILANIEAESGFNPAVYGDGGTSAGLFQHHAGRLSALKNYAASRGADWRDWRIQVDFAMKEAKQMGLNLQHTSAWQAAYEWCVKFERPANKETQGKKRANSASKFLFGHTDAGPPAQTGYSTNAAGGNAAPQGGAASGNAAPQGEEEKLNLPSGASFMDVGGKYLIAAYRFHGSSDKTGPSAVVFYRIDRNQIPAGANIGRISEQQLAEWRASGEWVDGGSVDALRGVPPGKSFQDLVDDTLMELGLAGTDALKDPGVMNIIAIAMTREMSPEELANRLRKTNWYQSRTDKQREWDDLSDAEKNQRIVDEAMQLAGLWFTYVGEDLSVDQYDLDGDGFVSADELKKGNADLYQWALKVASGEASQSQAVNVWLKAEAKKNPNSPWSRTLREEEQAQGQFEVDVENMAEQIRNLYWEWGIPVSDKELSRLAEDVVMNRMSMADVQGSVRDQANALYQYKPENLPTRTWAMPYMQMYMNTLESSEPSLDDPLLQRGLVEGMTLGDFRQMLRADDRWLETQNARDEFNEKVSQLGRVMGF